MRGVPVDGGPDTQGLRLLTEPQRSISPGPPRRDPHAGFYEASEAGVTRGIFGGAVRYGVFDRLADKFVVSGLYSYVQAQQVARKMNDQRPLD